MELTRIITASADWDIQPEFSDVLEERGFQMIEMTRTGENAVVKAIECVPDLMVIDMVLGGSMNGIDTAREIQRMKDIPVIFISDNIRRDCVKEACKIEPYGFLTKPVTADGLIAAMEIALCRVRIETRLNDIANTLPDVVYEIDEKGNLRFLSKSVTGIFGYEREEITTVHDVLNYFIPEDRQRVIENLDKTMKGIPGKEVEYTIQRKDGSFAPISIIANPIMNDGICHGSRGVIRDISERKMEQLRLGESEEKYRTLVENINDVHAILGLDGTIMYISPAIERVSAYKAEEITGKNFFEFIYQDDIPEIVEKHDRTLMGARRADEYRMVDKNGRIAWVRTSSSLIYHEGKAVGISSLMTDISEKRRLEEEIIHISEKERMRIGQDLHDGIGQYFTGLGYLFRTLIDMLPIKTKKVRAASEEITNLIGEAKKHVQMLSKGYYPVGMDSKGIIFAVEELCSGIEHMFDIACTFIYGEDISVPDNETAIHIYYIINEAVNNSIRHGKARNILIMMEKKDDKMLISIEDDGIGFNCDKEATTGLGLSIMKHRASIIGGTLKIREVEPSGTMVACILPMR